MSLLDVIAEFATGTYTVTRYAAVAPSGGVASAPTSSTITVKASIQPMRGRELQNLPEAQHGDEIRVVYSPTELLTRGPHGPGDVITIDGEPWRVVRVERWQAHGETHWRAYVSREANP